MAKAQDFSAIMKDFMGSFPVDNSAMEKAFKAQASFGEDFAGAVIEASGKAADLASKWSKGTIAELYELTKAKKEPAAYVEAMSECMASCSALSSEHLAAFAEISKKMQVDTVELTIAALKDVTDEANKVFSAAATEMSAAAKKSHAMAAK
ncbi:phasin, PhaP [Pseudooceanicola sp. CBS1P-1]|uniref:Phasin, PhaP n=1 Tax=Pseudooceanicola albus TaxID=2692189 RepID=A0A6L7G3Q4_9RHOB|nr:MULTISPECIES: phasin, PhaP [Pseudooceanicola]MBT9385066.1 phasin, PhaP [Pseudooceanicola endophyticus]MXN18641.1 phasin, PhaP [Pseudooceanicola albus]